MLACVGPESSFLVAALGAAWEARVGFIPLAGCGGRWAGAALTVVRTRFASGQSQHQPFCHPLCAGPSADTLQVVFQVVTMIISGDELARAQGHAVGGA